MMIGPITLVMLDPSVEIYKIVFYSMLCNEDSSRRLCFEFLLKGKFILVWILSILPKLAERDYDNWE